MRYIVKWMQVKEVDVSPMPDWLALLFLAVGFTSNSFGLYCGGRAFVVAWKTYGDGELWPALAAAKSRAKTVARRMLFWKKPESKVLAVSGTAHAVASASARITGRVGFSSEAPTTERLAALERAVNGVYDDLSADRGIANQRDSELRERLSSLTNKVSEEDARLEALSREIATGDVRLQLMGLVAIGFGTLMTAIPGIWGVIVSVAQG